MIFLWWRIWSCRSVTKTMTKRFSHVYWILRYWGWRNYKWSFAHWFEDLLWLAFLLPGGVFIGIFHILRKRLKISIQSFTISISISPSPLMCPYLKLSLKEIPLNIEKTYIPFDLVIIQDNFVAVEKISSKFIRFKDCFSFFCFLFLVVLPVYVMIPLDRITHIFYWLKEIW